MNWYRFAAILSVFAGLALLITWPLDSASPPLGAGLRIVMGLVIGGVLGLVAVVIVQRLSRPPATPPVNVRAFMPDGRQIPLDCRYLGWRRGRHMWETVWLLPEPFDRISMGVLPARTMVAVRFAVRCGADDD